MFWIISALLILIAFAFLLPPMLRKQSPEGDARREQNILIANEQLADLEARFEADEIEQSEYDKSRDEIELTLFSDMSESVDPLLQKNEKRAPLFSLLAVVLLIPLISILLYLKIGNTAFTTSIDSKKAAQVAVKEASNKAQTDIAELLDKKEKELKENPNNPEGWTMLGRSYMVMKRFPDAIKAYEKAYKLEPESLEIILSLANALVSESQGELAGRPTELINKALKLKPDNLTALWLGGAVSRQQKDYVTAIKRWKKVLGIIKDPKERKEVALMIKEVGEKVTPEQRKNLGIDALFQSEKKEQAAVDMTKVITVQVSLSDKMKEKVKPEDIVFIYAKAMSGPPMPLAAAKVQVKDLPTEVVLNDGMAMMDNMKLSSFTEVVVGARVSKSGQPIAQNGDLFTEKKSIKLGQKIQLNIDAIVVKNPG